MKPKVSVLLPTRGLPRNCEAVVQNLSKLSTLDGSFEMIVRVDDDDPALKRYEDWLKSRIDRPPFIKLIIGPHYRGYTDLNLMYDECAAQSQGEVLLSYNDDLTCKTQGWDMEYVFQAADDLFRPISSIVTGDTYRWAFPAITRELYEKVGQFCPGGVAAFDRVWDAVSVAGGWGQEECQANVTLHHPRAPMTPGTERAAHCDGVQKNWEQLNALWTKTGQDVIKKIRG